MLFYRMTKFTALAPGEYHIVELKPVPKSASDAEAAKLQ
jgi:hypothetical protein